MEGQFKGLPEGYEMREVRLLHIAEIKGSLVATDVGGKLWQLDKTKKGKLQWFMLQGPSIPMKIEPDNKLMLHKPQMV